MLRTSLFGILICGTLGIALGSAEAGRNANGALIVHSDPGLVYSSGPPDCGSALARPSDCAAANPDVEIPDGGANPIVWVLAAFPSAASPEVGVAQFGIDHSLPGGAVLAYDWCAPVILGFGSDGWPAAGTSVYMGLDPPATDRVVPLCWFAVAGSSGDFFSTTEDPVLGRAVFVDRGQPATEDAVDRFGTARWGSGGSNECPPSSSERETNWGEAKARYRRD
ncbi:MAG: hypothetical protein GF346_11240 [Candidatus Eisenbacteria bacterium]|nr:hypothetical protein [Candidatus Latescibacterota bacterium]MBD3303009.1 hypothetical protein [Candidatus Eisenbacteria bacterium]